MSDRCFVDTNILIYAHDLSAGIKHQRGLQLVEELWATGSGVLSTQVLQEFANTVRRQPQRPLSLEETVQVLRQYLEWQVVIDTPVSAVSAMELECRYLLSFWDALIVCAAQVANAA